MLKPITYFGFLMCILLFTVMPLAQAKPQGGTTIMELMSINKDYGNTQDVKDYWVWINPILKKHGGQILNIHEVKSAPDNAPEADFLFVIHIKEGLQMQDFMKSLMNDPEYQKNIPHRDKLYNFKKRYGYIGQTISLD